MLLNNNNNNNNNKFYIFFIFLIFFINLINGQFYILKQNLIFQKYPLYQGDNCTYDYLFTFNSTVGINKIIDLQNEFNTIKIRGGEYPNNNNEVTVLIQSLSVKLNEKEIKLNIFKNDGIIEIIAIDVQTCLLNNNLLSPINKNSNNVNNKFNILKSRYLNDTQTLIMYFNNLEGYMGFLNTLYFGGFLFKPISIKQKMYELKVLEFEYSFKKEIDGGGSDSLINWVHRNSNDQSIIESIKFESPILEQTSEPIYNFISMYPTLGSTLFNSNKTENIILTFNVSNSQNLNSVVASFVKTDTIFSNDTKSVYPVLGNPSNGQYIAFLNQYLGESLTWYIQSYSSAGNGLGVEFDSFKREEIDPIVWPTPANLTCISGNPHGINFGQSNYFITSNSFKTTYDFPISGYTSVSHQYHVDKIKYPYGFRDGNADHFEYSPSDIIPLNSVQSKILKFGCPLSSNDVYFTSFYSGQTSIPMIKSITYIPMVGHGMKTTIRISITDQYLGFYNATSSPPESNIIFTTKDLVWGDIFNGVYEKVVDFSLIQPIFSFKVYNLFGNSSEVFVEQFEKDKLIPIPSIGDITVFRFSLNNIDISNNGVTCTLYVNYTDANINYTPGFKLITSSEIARDFQFNKNYELLKWEVNLQLFKLNFEIPSRLFSGNLEYKFRFGNYDLDPISLSTLLLDYDDDSLKIKNNAILSVFSSNADEMPPTVISIKNLMNSLNVPYQSNKLEFGWDIEFKDQINGIESINVTIKSNFDVAGKTFTFFNNNNQQDIILFEIRDYIENSNCRNQTYRISEITTRDKNGHYSNSTLEVNYKNIINPLINIQNELSEYDILINCEQDIIVDSTPPDLKTLDINVTTIDVSSRDRYISVWFNITDIGSGINLRHLPYVYVTNTNNELLSFQTNSWACSANNINCKFGVVFELPFMFGYPHPLIISIYGVEDYFYNFGGFSSYHITSKSLNCTIDTSSIHSTPFISSTSLITGYGGDAELFGYWFGIDNLDNVIIHLYYDNNNHQTLKSQNFIYHTSKSLKFSTIEQFYNKLNIGIQVNGIFSNNITIASTLKSCSSDCGEPLGKGYCDNNYGICICNKNQWLGNDCSIPFHYITSVEASNINGGLASFNGEFSTIHNNLSLLIGYENCIITFNSSNLIQCIAPSGIGIKNVTLSQNGGTFIGINIYKYNSISFNCPNQCSGNGICNTETDICTCNIGYGLYDCSSLINNSTGNGINNSNTTIDTNNSTTNIISDNQTKFQIYIKQLNEIDINNNIIKSYPLLTDWIFNSTQNSIEPNKYIMKQQLIHNNENCIITSIIEEIKNENGKEFQFANINFKLLLNSIKFTVEINNYKYQNNLNTLQLEFISEVVNIDQNGNDCNLKDTQFDSYNNQNESSSSFNYIKLSKNNKIMVGRFINQVISDGKVTFLSLSTRNHSNSLIVTLNFPHCVSCLIDPDFSVLVSSDFKSKCDDSNNTSNRNWIIPVSVVVSVVGFLIIIVSLIMIYKKSTHTKIAIFKLKKIIKNK